MSMMCSFSQAGDDEKPRNYFCNLEKYNYSSKIIPKLDMEDGKSITDQFEILNTLNEEESNATDGPIKYEEAAKVLRAMSNNRSPGSDGFSAEFLLKCFGKNMSFYHAFN